MKKKVGNPNLGNEAKKAGTTFKKGQSGNPNGAPRRGVSIVLDELQKAGITPLSKTQIENIFLSIIDITEDRREELLEDKNTSLIIKIILEEMKSKSGFMAINNLLDRGLGKAKQVEEIKSEGESSKKEFYDVLKKKVDEMNQNDLNNTIQELLK